VISEKDQKFGLLEQVEPELKKGMEQAFVGV